MINIVMEADMLNMIKSLFMCLIHLLLVFVIKLQKCHVKAQCN